MAKQKIVKKGSGTKDAMKAAFDSSIPVFDMKGKKIETFQLDKELFTGKVNKDALYQAVVMYNACRRQGNASTKTRGDVSGGGKKPYRQKGTGRARAGSTRSPLWRHGGSVFGPHPRDYRYNIPKRQRTLALLSSVNSKLAENKMIGIAHLSVQEPKTKYFKAVTSALKLDGKSLFIIDEIDRDVMRASRNMQEVAIKSYRDFNAMDVLLCDNLVVSKPALEKWSGRFN